MEYYLSVTLRLLLAAILGGLIGLERESGNKAAGLKTHTLVSLGSCLIMITSIDIFETIGRGFIGDPGRIAAQVVSGIGFLGAGTILRSGFGVKGLTTAASLWLVAAIGLTVGLGSYFAATIATVIVFIILLVLPRFSQKVKYSHHQLKTIEIVILDEPGQLGAISSILGEFDVDIRSVRMVEAHDDVIKFIFSVFLPNKLNEEQIQERLSRAKGIKQIVFAKTED